MYKELLEFIIKNLVNHPDEVFVDETTTDEKVKLKVKVAKEDMGRVIGKEGRIIKSIREIFYAYGSKAKQKISVGSEEIKD